MIDGKRVAIRTGFRTWIRIWKIRESDLKDQVKLFTMLNLAYSKESIEEIKDQLAPAITEVLNFLSRKTGDDTPDRPLTKREKRLNNKRLFDWDFDASKIVSDFQREYQIDLTNPETKMHWWRFMALFTGLSDTSSIMNTIAIRGADLNDKSLSKEQKKHLREQKQSVMLPAKTKEEAEENRKTLRGY